MKAVVARLLFSSNQRRNQSATQIATEADSRGLVPRTLLVDGIEVTGQWSGTIADSSGTARAGLRLSYAGEDQAAMDAQGALYEWMDSRGFILDDSWCGVALIPGG